jgi:serine/threonine-protein kinase ATR
MNEDKRCELLSGIQMIACTATRSVQISNGVKGRTDVTLCKICDRNVPVQPSEEVRYYNNGEYAQFCKELLLIVTKLIQHPDMHHSMRPRILLTTLIRRLCNHISDPAILDLFQSSVGQWCLRSLTSSVRELRIAARQVILVQRWKGPY